MTGQSKRFKASESYKLPIFADGSGHYTITDTVTGRAVCTHRFPMPVPGLKGYDDWMAHNQKLASALADMLCEASPETLQRYLDLQAAAIPENFLSP